MNVFWKNNSIKLPSKFWKEGGEAEIYKIKGYNGLFKIFKQPNHPSFISPEERTAARQKIGEHQKKLIQLPKNLPSKVVRPAELLTNSSGMIVGYAMPFVENSNPLIQYSEKNWRDQGGIDNDTMTKILLGLYDTLFALHRTNVVVGDLNDMNVLVREKESYMIDTDSYQFGKFFCKTFTQTFVDPLICIKNGSELEQKKPHTKATDWYAFAIMVMKTLIFVGPYDGLYKPKDKQKKVSDFLRPLTNITVFDDEVKYPKFALPFREILPDELMQYFYKLFKENHRDIFPRHLLEDLEWKKCKQCGIHHARISCPNCTHITPAQVIESIKITGNIMASEIFDTTGVIVHACIQDDKLKWLYHENNSFKRENKKTICNGKLNPQIKFGIQENTTILAQQEQMVTLIPNKSPNKIMVEQYDSYPIFATNSQNIYWGANGQLWKDGEYGNMYIGDIVSDQTLFWTGEKFGFGLYKMGSLQMTFVFDAKNKGIHDGVKLPKLEGKLLDASAVFTSELCWFFAVTIYKGKRKIYCSVIDKKGKIKASLQGNQNDYLWLGNIRGKYAFANHVFAATDEGIVRMSLENGQVVQTREFPDTEKIVNSQSKLFVGNNGIYVVDSNKITHLKLN